MSGDNPHVMCALPDFVVDLMTNCVGCRRCMKVCPSHKYGGCSPWLSMIAKDPNTEMCIGCGKCSDVCRHTNPKLVMLYLKAEKLGVSTPEAFMKHGFSIPPASDDWKKELPEYKEGRDVFVMPGCIVQGKIPYLKYAAIKAFEYLGVQAGELPENTCCTYPVTFRKMDEAQRTEIKVNLRGNAAGRDLVTLCSGCTNELATSGVYAPNLCTYLAKYLDRIRALPGLKGRKVALEPGCASERFLTDFRMIVEAAGAEIVNKTIGCCGKNIDGISDKLMQERQAECQGADFIVVGCPNCQVFYDRVQGGIPVLHLSEYICLAAGDSETQRFHSLKIGN